MNKHEARLPVALLHEILRLDDDGNLTWLQRPVGHFRASRTRAQWHVAANWNANFAGTPALSCVTPFGHKMGRINGKPFYAHRVVWAMTTGEWPADEIDHINGEGGDNKPSNLRDVTHKQNLRNQRLRKTNTSGFNGVSFFKRDGTWAASIGIEGRAVHLGYFPTAAEANAARLAANALNQFHTNHGRKAA